MARTFKICTVVVWMAVAAILLFAVAELAVAHGDGPRVPRCLEDEMLEGRGNFGNGRWDRYACVHPDDVAAYMIEVHYKDPSIHSTVGGSVCEHPRFWNRSEGISIMPEACDGGGP